MSITRTTTTEVVVTRSATDLPVFRAMEPSTLRASFVTTDGDAVGVEARIEYAYLRRVASDGTRIMGRYATKWSAQLHRNAAGGIWHPAWVAALNDLRPEWFPDVTTVGG